MEFTWDSTCLRVMGFFIQQFQGINETVGGMAYSKPQLKGFLTKKYSFIFIQLAWFGMMGLTCQISRRGLPDIRRLPDVFRFSAHIRSFFSLTLSDEIF